MHGSSGPGLFAIEALQFRETDKKDPQQFRLCHESGSASFRARGVSDVLLSDTNFQRRRPFRHQGRAREAQSETPARVVRRQSSAAGALKVGGAGPECFPLPLTCVTCVGPWGCDVLLLPRTTRLLSCETILPEDGRIFARAAVGPRRSVRYKRSAALMSCLFIRWLTSSVPDTERLPCIIERTEGAGSHTRPSTPPGSTRDALNRQRRRREGRRCARLGLFASPLPANAAGGAEAAGPNVCVPPPQLLRARLAATHATCRQGRVKTRALFRF
ncbi:hypothetical protein MRX96_002792 [Rhipicephalus microplus]